MVRNFEIDCNSKPSYASPYLYHAVAPIASTPAVNIIDYGKLMKSSSIFG